MCCIIPIDLKKAKKNMVDDIPYFSKELTQEEQFDWSVKLK
jgi:hypothetical protein